MNGYKYELVESPCELSNGDYYINGQERFLQKFYMKEISFGAGGENVYIYRENNPFGNKFLFNSKMFRMSKKWSSS